MSQSMKSNIMNIDCQYKMPYTVLDSGKNECPVYGGTCSHDKGVLPDGTCRYGYYNFYDSLFKQKFKND